VSLLVAKYRMGRECGIVDDISCTREQPCLLRTAFLNNNYVRATFEICRKRNVPVHHPSMYVLAGKSPQDVTRDGQWVAVHRESKACFEHEKVWLHVQVPAELLVINIASFDSAPSRSLDLQRRWLRIGSPFNHRATGRF